MSLQEHRAEADDDEPETSLSADVGAGAEVK